MNLDVSIFEEPDELTTLLQERETYVNVVKSVEEKEIELKALLQDLQSKKVEAQRQAYAIRYKIQDLERKRQLELEEQEKLRQLKLDAVALEEYAEKLEELCNDLPAFQKARPYQVEDLVYSLKAFMDGKSGILNANAMALGKTYEAIILLYCIKKLDPKAKILWLTKKSLCISTPKEIKRWWPEAHMLTSAVANTVKERNTIVDMITYGADMLVANYEFVRTTPSVNKIAWDVIVVDEAHKLKGGANPGGPTDIWTKVKDLCKSTKFNIFLTGTPMVNRPEEMWSYLHIFNPVKFPDLRSFQRNFMQYKSFSRNFEMEIQATKLLDGILKGQMLRRIPSEVGLQMPDITEEVIELEMHPQQREVYDQMKQQFYIWLESQSETVLTATAILAQLTRLRQINAWPSNIKFKNNDDFGNEIVNILDVPFSSKIDEAMEIIDRVDEQIVVFCTFNEPLFEIERRCRKAGIKAVVLNGDNSNSVGEIENNFQQERIQVLCMNSSVGEGLNLQKDQSKWPGGASFGIMIDRWWNNSRNDQCIARIVRPGSSAKGVFYILENIKSVDAFINELCITKTESFASITESKMIRPNNWKEHLEQLI